MKKLLPMIGLALLLGGCGGGAANQVNEDQGSAASQAMWPVGDENPDDVFQRADSAFQSGDYWEAQRLFGTLFIIAPDYRGGMPTSAIVETCRAIGDNCDLVFGRLEFLRDAVYGAFGPSNQWPNPQWRDFDAILAGYDAGIMGDYITSVNICGPLTGAPMPEFAMAADRCAAISDQLAGDQYRMQQAEGAVQDWNLNYPCMENNRRSLMEAYEANDWEMFVNVYPQYQQCASVLQEIIDAEILLGHPGVDDWDYNLAWSNIGEMDLIVEDNQRTIDEVSDATIALDSNPQYNQLVMDWERYHTDEEDLLNRISTMEMARDNMPPGRDRNTLEQQIDMMQGQLGDVRRDMRTIMGEINAMRRDEDLPARETP